MSYIPSKMYYEHDISINLYLELNMLFSIKNVFWLLFPEAFFPITGC